MKFAVGTKPTPSGFTVTVNEKSHNVKYPAQVWQAFPTSLRRIFAESIAFMSTVHLSFPQRNFVNYEFSTPFLESFFYHGLLMAMPENWTDKENPELKSSQFIKAVYNSFYNTNFRGKNVKAMSEMPLYRKKTKRVIIPFSFGKDSLLTYALCKELGYEIFPIFLIESRNKHENRHKLGLIKEFEQEFHQPIDVFQVPLTDLKHLDAYSWGWDLLLTQYTFYLVPYLHYYKPEYFFWSNELNCSQLIVDPEGFNINRTFDQHWRWLKSLNTALGILACNIHLGSIVEPISEYADCIILHKRYPEIAKYHLTCQAEHPEKRWCGNCYDCANSYLYLVSIGVDPKIVGLAENMFARGKIHKLKFFESPKIKNFFWRDTFLFNRNEKLIAFYLAYKQEINDYALLLYKKTYLRETLKHLSRLKQTYLSVHEFNTAPDSLRNSLRTIFEIELRKMAR